MLEFLKILSIIFVIFGVSFLLMNIRHLFTGKEFRGSCASNNPLLKNEFGECNVCGQKPSEDCDLPKVKA